MLERHLTLERRTTAGSTVVGNGLASSSRYYPARSPKKRNTRTVRERGWGGQDLSTGRYKRRKWSEYGLEMPCVREKVQKTSLVYQTPKNTMVLRHDNR